MDGPLCRLCVIVTQYTHVTYRSIYIYFYVHLQSMGFLADEGCYKHLFTYMAYTYYQYMYRCLDVYSFIWRLLILYLHCMPCHYNKLYTYMNIYVHYLHCSMYAISHVQCDIFLYINFLYLDFYTVTD